MSISARWSMSEPASPAYDWRVGFVRCRAAGHRHSDGIRHAAGEEGTGKEDQQQRDRPQPGGVMSAHTQTILIRPADAHNARLVSNVHPLDWQNPTRAPCYNLVVIGAGTAGLVTAAGAAGLGGKVALVERWPALRGGKNFFPFLIERSHTAI